MDTTHRIPTAWGDVKIESRGSYLTRLSLPTDAGQLNGVREAPRELTAAIAAYFEGQPIRFAVSFGYPQLDDMYLQATAWWETGNEIFPHRGAACPAVPVRLDLTDFTPYLSRVLAAAAAIPWGQTISYGELGYLVSGNYRQARAVGMVMRLNPLPLIIPCHRVVAKKGPGGFSGGTGVDYKLKMLALENA